MGISRAEYNLQQAKTKAAAEAPVYSAPVQAYVDQLNAYAATLPPESGLTAQLKNAALAPQQYENRGIGGVKVTTTPESVYKSLMASNTPVESLYNQGVAFKTNKDNDAGFVVANPEAEYKIVNKRGADTVLYEGKGVGALTDIQKIAQSISDEQGKKASWEVYVKDPASQNWTKQAEDNPAKSLLGKIADIGLPILGAALMPVTGGLSGALAAGLGAAAGSAISGIAQGRGVGDILKSATIAGIGSFGGASLLGGAAGGAGSAASSAGGSGAAAGIGSTAGAAAGSGAGSAAGSLAGDIVVNGIRTGIGSTIGAGLGAGAGSGIGSALLSGTNAGTVAPPSQSPGDITVVGTPQGPITIPPAAVAGGIGGGLGNVVTPPSPGDIVVTATPEQPYTMSPGSVVGAAIPPILTTVPPFTVQTPAVTTPGTGILGTGVTATDIPSLVTGVTGVVGGIGNALGGGGGGGGGGPLDGGGTVDIPAAINAAKRTARTPTYDPFTYGQVGGDQPEEFAFYQGYAEGGEVDEDDHARHAAAFASGIGHRGPGPVRGIGSGQSDEIPAWVANDEYIWSAQDVADLGDGSSTEGHRRLDRMRQMVRRRAGRKDVKNIAKPQRGIGELLTAVGA